VGSTLCLYQDAVKVAQCNFRSLREVPAGDLIFTAQIPGLEEAGFVEISPAIFHDVIVIKYVTCVRIALESGMPR
jgi:hypothetical protein